MIIQAKFPATCSACGKRIATGQSIDWQRGRKSVRHADCKATDTAAYDVQSDRRPPARQRYGSSYTRFSSGAEVYTNRRGRCEDAPCCGCCS